MVSGAPFYLWRCKVLSRPTHGTLQGQFSRTPEIPLRFLVSCVLACSSVKKKSPRYKYAEETGLSYRARFHDASRSLRHGRRSGDGPMLSGRVEVDETYVGGKPRYKERVNKGRMGRGTDKFPVLAMVERGGNVRA